MLLYKMLNRHTLTSEEEYVPDWLSAFDVIGIPKRYQPLVASNANPTGCLMELWANESIYCERPPNLAELQTVLGHIDRWDILDDISEMLQEDATQFLSRIQQPNPKEMEIITKDDTHDDIQHYDAFILYTDRDIAFVSEVIEHLETEGYLRDWRGAFDVIGIPERYQPLVASNANPTGCLMELWAKESSYCARPPNLAELQTVLGCIDRWDIVDDTSKMFPTCDDDDYLDDDDLDEEHKLLGAVQ
ncbi:hypothetical protein AND_005744 [Anopheles darlingi]|uniref:TIR domain-containing protein n=1 Tax=Anopheles darlingi TaxID=43151 RepID=W5JI28_ANODA|nr:hypothetical protein AND_005744 [Anopheles darlingi]